MTLEIDEIKAGSCSRRTPPRLNTPARSEPRAFRQLEVCRWTDKQRLPCKFLQAGPFVFPQVTRFTAEQETGTQLRHDPKRRTCCGFPLHHASADKARPLRFVDQVERRDDAVRHELPVECQPEFGPETLDPFSRGLVDPMRARFRRKGKPE